MKVTKQSLKKQHEKLTKEIPKMSEYKKIESEIGRLTTQMAEFIKTQQKELAENFEKFLKEIFNEYPNLVSFSWTQGTPSFCDGDPCYFRAYLDDDDDFKYEGFDYEIHSSYANLDDNTVTLDWREKKTRPALPIEIEYRQITKMLEEFISDDNMEGVLKSLYGDGTKVIVTRDGVETEEYYMD